MSLHFLWVFIALETQGSLKFKQNFYIAKQGKSQKKQPNKQEKNPVAKRSQNNPPSHSFGERNCYQ